MIAGGFFEAYLVSYVYWLAFPLGASALLMMYRLTGGAWGDCTRNHLKAASATIAPFALLFLPILFAQHDIYPWTRESVRATMHGGNLIYLTEPFFAARTVFYFVGWVCLAAGAIRGNPRWVRIISAGGLVFFGFSTSFASFDWQMSLEPQWHSTVYGLVFGVDLVLEAWAAVLLALSLRGDFARQTPKTQRDMTNLLLAFVMIWAYLSYVQYLIIWCGNIPDELLWMRVRTQRGWQSLAVAIVLAQFALPFSLLLFRRIKTRARNVAWIAGIVLAARLVEQYWYIEPSLHEQRIAFDPWIVPTFVGIGAAWLWLFRARLAAEERKNAA